MTEVITSKEFALIAANEGDIIERIKAAQEQLERVEINTDDDFAKGGTFIKLLKNLKKEIDDTRKALVGPMNDEVKLVNARFKERTTQVDSAINAVQPKLDAFLAEAEKQRQAAIEAERAEREAQALENAESLEAQGASEAAELALVQGTQKTAAEKKKLSATSEYGVTTSARETWTGHEADKKAILQAVLDGKLPLDAVSISQSALNAYARDKKEEGVFDGIMVARKLQAVAR